MSTMGYVSTLSGAEDAASLNLDFKNQRYKVAGVSKAFSDVITFNRPSTAGRFNQNGVYEMVGVDQPRFDYDPATKLIKGLLVEDSRQNYHTYSEDFNNAVWNRGVSPVLTKPTNITSPIGVAHKFREQSTAGPHFLQRSWTPGAGTTWASTRILKAAERTEVRGQIWTTTALAQTTFNLANGTMTGAGSITHIGDGWYICTMIGTCPTAVSTADRWYPADSGGTTSYVGDGVSGYYIAGSQLEIGTFPTSYVPNPTTFVSRASTGTYFDNNGVLQVAGNDVARYDFDPVTKNSKGLMTESASTNLLPMSKDFEVTSVWTKNSANTTVVQNTTIAPDGTQTADTLGDSGNGDDFVYTNLTMASPTSAYCTSVFVKKTTSALSTFGLWCLRSGGTTAQSFVVSIDTNTGTIWSSIANTGSVTDVGDYWRVSLTSTDNATGNTVLQVRLYPAFNLVADANSSRRNETTGSSILWGVQCEVGSSATSYIPTGAVFTSRTSSATYFDANGVLQTAPSSTARYDYNPTTGVSKGMLVENARTNSLTYTDNIQAVLWTTTASSLKPNTTLAPDGTMTGTKLIEDTTTAIHYIDKLSSTGTVTAGTVYTISAFVKAGERNRVRLVGVISTGAPTTGDAFFDLVTGTVVSTTNGVSDPRIEAVGNGWYRCSALVTVQAGSSAMTPRAYYQLVSTGTTFNYAGDGASGLYVWGPQLEIGNSPTSYMPSPAIYTSRASTATWLDSNGFMQTAATNVARTNAYMYDDTNTLKPVGMLIERNPATNLAKFSNEWTNAAWTKASGVAISTDGTLAPDGTVAQKFTLSGAGGHEVWSSLATPLTVGTTYTLSVWLKPIGAVVPSFQLAYYDGSTIVAGAGGNANNQVVGQWKRYSFTFTPGTTPAAPRIRLVGFSGGFDGNSFYMFNCQLEAGNYATSDIFSGASEVTRAAEFSSSTATTRASDVYTTPTSTRATDIVTSASNTRQGEFASVNNLSPWFNQPEGTLTTEFVQTLPLTASTFRRPVSLAAAPGLGEISLYLNGTTGNVAGFVSPAPGMDSASGAGVYVPGEFRRSAIAYKLNDCIFSTKGVASSADTTVTIPTIVTLYVGGGNAGGNRMNAHVRSVNYYPRRLTNAEIPVISA